MAVFEPGIHVRPPVEGDLETLAQLILRFYRFNEEFDPAWAVVGDAEEKAREVARRYIEGEGLTLVALVDDKVVGYLHAEIRENPMLATGRLGVITELYVHPQYRRRGLASRLVEEAARRLAERGVEHVAAEFPSKNYVAEAFYSKRGFRPYTSIYLREV